MIAEPERADAKVLSVTAVNFVNVKVHVHCEISSGMAIRVPAAFVEFAQIGKMAFKEEVARADP